MATAAKLGEPCPKVRLSQDMMTIEALTQQQSWVRGKRPFLPPPARLGEEKKALSPLPQLSWGRGKGPFPPHPALLLGECLYCHHILT
jgi:hypothetical protein